MIRDVLLPELMERFPNRGFQTQSSGNTIGLFPAAHPGVGNVYIADDGDEATLFIGDLTHLHFNFDPGETEPEKGVANDVLEFLDELFADRILIWKSRSTGGDGVMPLETANVFFWHRRKRLNFCLVWPCQEPQTRRRRITNR